MLKTLLPPLVRYCPGDAPGYPVEIPTEAVESRRAADAKYVEELTRHGGARFEPSHTGPCGPRCRWNRDRRLF